MSILATRADSKMHLNLNTALLIAGMALIGWLAQYFVTKEEYNKDQARVESGIRDLNVKQDRVITILLEKK